MRWRPAFTHDILYDTYFEFPPVSGLELARIGMFHDPIRSTPRAHRQGLVTAYAYHRRAGR